MLLQVLSWNAFHKHCYNEILGSFRFLIHDAESSDLGKSALLRRNKEENAALGETRFRVMG